jgi:tetratricopeptide (TPR) repeat protein
VYYCNTLVALSRYWYEDLKFKTAKLFIYEEDANCETVLINLVNNQHSDTYSTATAFFRLLDRHLRRRKTKLADIIRDLDETDDLKYIECLDAVGYLEFEMANYLAAETILNRAHRLSVNLGSDSAEAGTSMSLGTLHLYLSNYEDAELFLVRAGFLYGARSLHSAVCNRRLAAVYRLQGNLVKARSFANDAIAQLKERYDSDFAWCLLELGQIELSLKNIPAAKSILTQAKDTVTKIGDDCTGHVCDRLLAGIAIDEGDYFRAQIVLDGARKVATLHNDPHEEALCDVLLGFIQERLLHYDTARELYQKARDVNIQVGSKYDAADCVHYLGGLDKNLGNLEVAVKWFLLAGEEFVGIKVVHRAHNCADSIRGLADDMVLQGDHEPAKRAFVNAEELYAKINRCRAEVAERGEKLSLGD